MDDTRFAPGYVWCYDHREGKEPNPMLGLTLRGPVERAAAIYLYHQRIASLLDTDRAGCGARAGGVAPGVGIPLTSPPPTSKTQQERPC